MLRKLTYGLDLDIINDFEWSTVANGFLQDKKNNFVFNTENTMYLGGCRAPFQNVFLKIDLQ